MKLILLIIFVAVYSLNGFSSGQENSTLFENEPSYSLLTRTSNTQLNTGDIFKIELFISGAGDVEFSGISTYIPEQITENKEVLIKIVEFDDMVNVDPIDRYLNPHKPEIYEDVRRPIFTILIPDNIYDVVRIPIPPDIDTLHQTSYRHQLIYKNNFININNKINASLSNIDYSYIKLTPLTSGEHNVSILRINMSDFENQTRNIKLDSENLTYTIRFSDLNRSDSINLTTGLTYTQIPTQYIFTLNRTAESHPIVGFDYEYPAPFTIEFTIANDAAPGDHEISINYFYKNSGKWYCDEELIKIHINRYYEKENFKYIAAVILIIGGIAAVLNIIESIYSLRQRGPKEK